MQEILEYIQSYLVKKIEVEYLKEKNKQPKPTEKALDKRLQELQQEYQIDNWLNNCKASFEKMNEIGFSLATHTAKGIHSSSKSSNVIFKAENHHKLLGSHSIQSLMIDANNNNTAVHVANLSNITNFLNIVCGEKRVHNLIVSDDVGVMELFDKRLSANIFAVIKSMLSKNIESNPKISELEKQMLFPLPNDEYFCIYPLYPTSLAHEIFLKISHIKYSEENKNARQQKKEKTGFLEHTDIMDLAYVKLGGKKPLNVSVFNKDQNGKNYLLPSMPPIFKQTQDIRIPMNVSTIFETKSVKYQIKFHLEMLFKLIKVTHNNHRIREAISSYVSKIAYEVISLGETLQTIRPAGWTKDYHSLSMSQKYWLDPKRAELEGEKEFKQARETEDWRTAIEVDFANWLQGIFKTEFKAFAHDFADPEHNEWRREMEDEIKKALRLGKGGLV